MNKIKAFKMKSKLMKIFFISSLIVLFLLISGCFIFYFINKDKIEIMRRIDKQRYVNKNVFLSKYYDRETLNTIFNHKINVAETVRYFGQPSAVSDTRLFDQSVDFSGMFLYLYNPSEWKSENQLRYGKGFNVIFSNGEVSDWDIIDNGITIKPINLDDANKLLHCGMTIDEVNILFGEPSRVVHENHIISAYEYYFDLNVEPSAVFSIRPSIMIFFNSNGNVSSWNVSYIQFDNETNQFIICE